MRFKRRESLEEQRRGAGLSGGVKCPAESPHCYCCHLSVFGTEIVNVLWHLEAWFYNLQCCAAFLPFIQYILTEHPLSVGPVLDIRVITLSKAVLIHGAHCSDT